MNQTLTYSDVFKIALLDILLLFAVFFLTALAHTLPFPVYYLDPMRLLLFTGFFFSKNKYNGLIIGDYYATHLYFDFRASYIFQGNFDFNRAHQ